MAPPMAPSTANPRGFDKLRACLAVPTMDILALMQKRGSFERAG